MATKRSLTGSGAHRKSTAVGGERTKTAAITRALEEFVARRKQMRAIDLMGQLKWDDSFDMKAERSRK